MHAQGTPHAAQPSTVPRLSVRRIDKGTPEADLLLAAKLIIWDVAPVMNRFAFEAVDRTLQDLTGSRALFGGKVVVMGGDFRQILPVVRRGSPAKIVAASLCRHVHERMQLCMLAACGQLCMLLLYM